MPILSKLREFLDQNNVSYEVLQHPEAFTAQEVAAAQHVPGKEVAKVVMVRGGKDYLMAVVTAPCRLDLVRLRAATGNTALQLATEQEFAGLFPACEPGAMPPFGNLYGVAVWVDTRLTEDRQIIFNAGNHRQTVRMAYADFARLVNPSVADIAQGPGK